MSDDINVGDIVEVTEYHAKIAAGSRFRVTRGGLRGTLWGVCVHDAGNLA